MTELKGIICIMTNSDGGLRMIDVEAFAQAQKLVWAKHLLDPNYDSFWKVLESEVLKVFHNDTSVLWKADAPNCVLALLRNTQLNLSGFGMYLGIR